jgi:hypothetical protein
MSSLKFSSGEVFIVLIILKNNIEIFGKSPIKDILKEVFYSPGELS